MMVIFTVTAKQEAGKQTAPACAVGADSACAAGAIAIRTAKDDVSAIRGAKMRRRSLSRGTGGSLVKRTDSEGEDSPTHCDAEPRMTVGRHVEQATGCATCSDIFENSRCNHVACVAGSILAPHDPWARAAWISSPSPRYRAVSKATAHRPLVVWTEVGPWRRLNPAVLDRLGGPGRSSTGPGQWWMRQACGR